MKKPSITIRLGAAYDEVTVDGVTFDRSTMKREDKSKLRRLVRDAFTNLNDRGLWGRVKRLTPAQTVLAEAGRHAPAYRRSSRQRSVQQVAA